MAMSMEIIEHDIEQGEFLCDFIIIIAVVVVVKGAIRRYPSTSTASSYSHLWGAHLKRSAVHNDLTDLSGCVEDKHSSSGSPRFIC